MITYTCFEDLLGHAKYGFFNKMTANLVCFIGFLLGVETVTLLGTCLSAIPSIGYYKVQNVSTLSMYNCFFAGYIFGYLALGCLTDANGRLNMMNLGLHMLPICSVSLVLSSNLGLCYSFIIASSALLAGLTVATRVYFVEYSLIETRGKAYLSLAASFSLGTTCSLIIFILYPSVLFSKDMLQVFIVLATVTMLLFQVSQFLHPSLRFLLYQRQRIGAYLRHMYTLNTKQHEKEYKVPRKVQTRKLIEQMKLREALRTSPEAYQVRKKIISLFSEQYLKQTICLLLISSVIWVNSIHYDIMLLNTVITNSARQRGIRIPKIPTFYLIQDFKLLTTYEMVALCISPVLVILVTRPFSDRIKRTSLLSSAILAQASLQCLILGFIRSYIISRTIKIGLICLVIGLSSVSAIILELMILENLPTKMRAVGFSIFKTVGMITYVILFNKSLMSEGQFLMLNILLLVIALYLISALNDRSKKPMLEILKNEHERANNV